MDALPWCPASEAAMNLSVENEECTNLGELVRDVRGTLNVSARSWVPAYVRHIRWGLEANNGLKGLSLDFQGCHYSNDDLRCLVDAVAQHKNIESFELCLYQEESEREVVLDESVGQAVGNLLENGTLQHLRFVNWFGYVMSVGFVREMSRGLSNTITLVSFELRNCVLPRASYGFLISALRRSATKAATLENLTVGIVDTATLEEITNLFEALKDVKNLKCVRITPCHLPSEAIAASILERAVQENPSIQYVSGVISAAPESRRRRRMRLRRLVRLLETNRHFSDFRALLDTPGTMPLSVWPIVFDRLLGVRSGDSPDDNDADVRSHRANQLSKAMRRLLPWLLTQSQKEEAVAQSQGDVVGGA